MVFVLQAHKVIQGTAKHTRDILLHEGVGIGVGGRGNIIIPRAHFVEGLRALSRSTTLIPYR